MAGAVFAEVGGCLCLALQIVKNGLYKTRFNHEMHFAWHAQYLVTPLLRALGITFYMKYGSICEMDVTWQAQYLVKVEDDFCCAAYCK